eukprot:CAMPEP_0176223512 /NCGR_PEP_ID=MMETSP0121_2-20121125/20781_1 /TAXON_ID=160619 /ORGANISM="Kryptoperidinium foliaceum, Strain CCMP 1326" /LENGTH=168 /DNA_ID=CAMNT_0017562745 /DNA_START=383 /DNA_END=887 /DNA_ORIENTATION=+
MRRLSLPPIIRSTTPSTSDDRVRGSRTDGSGTLEKRERRVELSCEGPTVTTVVTSGPSEQLGAALGGQRGSWGWERVCVSACGFTGTGSRDGKSRVSDASDGPASVSREGATKRAQGCALVDDEGRCTPRELAIRGCPMQPMHPMRCAAQAARGAAAPAHRPTAMARR